LSGLTFYIQANGQNVGQVSLSNSNANSNGYNDIEVQFPSTDATLVIVLGFSSNNGQALSASNTNGNQGWAISDFAMLSNACGAQFFFNTNAKKCQYAGNSIFYALVFIDMQGNFNNYTTTQPNWLSTLNNGNSDTNGYFYYIINGQAATQNGALGSGNYNAQTSLYEIYIELAGSNFNFGQWTVNNGNAGQTTLNNANVFGTFNFGTTLSRTFTNLGSQQSVVIRFRLYLVNWAGQNFTVQANGVQVFSSSFTGNNQYQDVEIQMALTGVQFVFVFGVNAGSASSADNSNLQWALSDFGLLNNACGVNKVFNFLQNKCVSSGKTAMYSLVTFDYAGQLSGLAQPAWLLNMLGQNGELNNQNVVYYIYTGDNGSGANNAVGYSGYSTQATAPTQTTTPTQVATPTKPATPNSNGTVLVDLTGDSNNWDYSSWQIKNSRDTAQVNNLYNQDLFGTFGADTVLRNVFNGLGAHSTVTLRFRLYLVGIWTEQTFWVQSAGSQVFSFVFGVSDSWLDLEITFDHNTDSLDLTIGTTANATTGARSGLEYGISDFGVYANPCVQKSFFQIANKACSANAQHSTFYSLVTVQLSFTFLQSSLYPSWENSLTTQAFYFSFANQVFSFLIGDQLEIISGPQGTSQFQTLDLTDRLKQQINNTVVSNNNSVNISYLAGKSSNNIISDQSGAVQSQANGYNNLFGTQFTTSKVQDFSFSFGALANGSWACVGFIEATGDSLPLTASYRNSSLVVCSDDNAVNPSSNFTIHVDVANSQIVFKNTAFNTNTTQAFNSINDLVYTVQFYGMGEVDFNNNLVYYKSLRNLRRL